jgi:DNA-binding transcriptional ArsR family regulator
LKETISQLFSRILARIRSIGVTHTPIDKEIVQGKALQVYWFLLTHDTASIREIQRVLDFASPGTVTYQISKLESAGVVAKDPEQDKYRIRAEIKSGILGFYIRVGYRMIPRFSIYLMLFLFGLFCFVLAALERGDAFITDPFNWIILLILFSGIFAFIFESVRIWRMRPQ